MPTKLQEVQYNYPGTTWLTDHSGHAAIMEYSVGSCFYPKDIQQWLGEWKSTLPILQITPIPIIIAFLFMNPLDNESSGWEDS